MKNVFVVLVVALAATVAFASGGDALVQKYCSQCHSADKPMGITKSQGDWESTVARMVSKMEARGKLVPTAEEQKVIVEFLTNK